MLCFLYQKLNDDIIVMQRNGWKIKKVRGEK